jgi:hypothetical protein
MWPAWDSELVQWSALMSPESHAPLVLVLSRRSAGGRLAVDLQSFLRFNAQMDQQLELLVKRWSDFSTPASRQLAARASGPWRR